MIKHQLAARIAICGLLLATPLLAWRVLSKTNKILSAAGKVAYHLPQDYAKSQFDVDLATVNRLRDARDLLGLVRIADEIEVKWPTISTEYYAWLMVNVVNSLHSYRFTHPNQDAFAIKYTEIALQKGNDLPLDAEVQLALFLGLGPEYANGQMKQDQWLQDRRERAAFILHAWRRLESEMDPAFNPKNRPISKVMPPPGYGPAGIAPQSIKDPQVRAKYQADFEAHQRRLEEYFKQESLRRSYATFRNLAETFIVDAYSQPPSDVEELGTLLENSDLSLGIRQELIDKVAKRMSTK
jgi:hypothetical protein